VDYDGDGVNDIFGCGFDGFVAVIKGRGKLDFAPAERLKDSDGKEINGGKYWCTKRKKWVSEGKGAHILEPRLVDWDTDGDLDLFIGGRQGELYVMLNKGTRGEPSFSPDRTPVLLQGSPHYESADSSNSSPSPAIVDWDGDGLLDLLICFGRRKEIVWHRNIGKKGQPDFDAADSLLDFSQTGKPKSSNRLSVADYNSDGKLDLIIGGGVYISQCKEDSGAWIYLQK
jgi:hypothetical protein